MRTTQNKVILEALRRRGQITAQDALRMGITRLSARIWDLRRDGHCIAAERKKITSRWGVSTVATYRLNTREASRCKR